MNCYAMILHPRGSAPDEDWGYFVRIPARDSDDAIRRSQDYLRRQEGVETELTAGPYEIDTHVAAPEVVCKSRKVRLQHGD